MNFSLIKDEVFRVFIAVFVICLLSFLVIYVFPSCSIEEEKDMTEFDFKHHDAVKDFKENSLPPEPRYSRPTYGIEIPDVDDNDPWDDLIMRPVPEPLPCTVCGEGE